MIGRYPTSNGLARIEEPGEMIPILVTSDELSMLVAAVERKSVAAERDGNLSAADRQAARAYDLRLKGRGSAQVPLHRSQPRRHAALITTTWAAAVPA